MTDPKRPVESFARLYDDILESRKVAGLTPAEFGLYCAMLSYSHRNDTDGLVPSGRAKGLLNFDSGRAFLGALDALIVATLVESRPGEGWLIHDYDLHNETHAERNARRIAARNAARIRWSNAGGNTPSTASGSAESMPRRKEKGKGELNASSVGSLPDDDPGMMLAVKVGEILGRTLSALEIQACQQAIVEFPYLIVSEFTERAIDHQTVCKQRGWPLAQSVQGFWEAWRTQSEYKADHGAMKPRGKSTGSIQQIGAVLRGDS